MVPAANLVVEFFFYSVVVGNNERVQDVRLVSAQKVSWLVRGDEMQKQRGVCSVSNFPVMQKKEICVRNW